MTIKMVLLIHKEPNMMEILQSCLADLGGWNVQVASSFLEGLQQAIINQPDAIILIELPINMRQGSLFLKQLQKQPETKNIPVVILILRGKWLNLQQSWFKDDQVKVVIVNPLNFGLLPMQIANALGWE